MSVLVNKYASGDLSIQTDVSSAGMAKCSYCLRFKHVVSEVANLDAVLTPALHLLHAVNSFHRAFGSLRSPMLHFARVGSNHSSRDTVYQKATYPQEPECPGLKSSLRKYAHVQQSLSGYIYNFE